MHRRQDSCWRFTAIRRAVTPWWMYEATVVALHTNPVLVTIPHFVPSVSGRRMGTLIPVQDNTTQRDNTTQWKQYYTVKIILHSEDSNTQWKQYYTVRIILHSESNTTQWGQYYTVKAILHSEDSTTQWKQYYTVRTVLHSKDNTTQWGQ